MAIHRKTRIFPLFFLSFFLLNGCSSQSSPQIFLVSNLLYSASLDVTDEFGNNAEQARILSLVDNLNSDISNEKDVVIFDGGIVSSLSTWKIDFSVFLHNYANRIKGTKYYIPSSHDTNNVSDWENIAGQSLCQIVETDRFRLILASADIANDSSLPNEQFVTTSVAESRNTSKYVIPISPWWYGDDYIKNNIGAWSENQRFMMFFNGLTPNFFYDSTYCNTLTSQGRVIPIVSVGNYSHSFKYEDQVDFSYRWGFCKVSSQDNSLKLTHRLVAGDFECPEGNFISLSQTSYSLELPVYGVVSWRFLVVFILFFVFSVAALFIFGGKKCFSLFKKK